MAIGELLIDGITSAPVQDLSQAVALNIHPGGSPGNFCRYLKRCGIPTAIIASVGNDGLGRILLDKVEEEGIDTKLICRQDRNTSFIVVARTSETPDFIAYRDADMYIDPIDPALITGASLLHTTAFALSRNPARESILQAFELAYRNGIPVSVDWNYAEEIWGKHNQAAAVFERLQQFNPLVKCSLDDIERFTGCKNSVEEACAFLDKVQASAICLTCGGEGVFYKAGGPNEAWQYQAAEKITVRNATGAGDAFWAGFVSSLYREQLLSQAVQQGIHVASVKLQDRWNELVPA